MSNSQHILRKFTIDQCDTDCHKFVNDIADTFDQLSPDYYDQTRTQVEFLKTVYPEHASRLQALLLRNNHPDELSEQLKDLVDKLDFRNRERFYSIRVNRFRSIAKFSVSVRSNNDFDVERIPVGAFVQSNLPPGDIRSMPRHFAETSTKITEHPGFHHILQFVCQQVASTKELSRLSVTFHQVCTYAQRDRPFLLSDGIHQDGMDYIVSAIPIILDQVVVPLSTVYMPDMRPILETHLQVGEGILHDDHNYWHGVSAVNSSHTLGRRGSIGLDIDVIA